MWSLKTRIGIVNYLKERSYGSNWLYIKEIKRL